MVVALERKGLKGGKALDRRPPLRPKLFNFLEEEGASFSFVLLSLLLLLLLMARTGNESIKDDEDGG